jgi:Ca-activated chloride channel family protein
VPISIGVLVDTSASMLEALPEAQKAAMGFLDYSIGPRDRGFTISFDNEPYILSKLTNRKDKLYRSLAGLRAEGSTALYDAIVYGLYQFTGVKGKKALVILSDGKDTSSKFDYDTLLEYVKKSGISIYAVGLKIPTAELDVKYKLNKLAQVTGGQTFMIDSVKNLESVYKQINDELRSQYLLTYYSTNTEGKDKWRKVEVKVEPTNLVARTLTGITRKHRAVGPITVCVGAALAAARDQRSSRAKARGRELGTPLAEDRWRRSRTSSGSSSRAPPDDRSSRAGQAPPLHPETRPSR